MLRNILNWRTALALIAISIVIGTIVYATYLSKQLQLQERSKIDLWVAAKNTEIISDDVHALNLAGIITTLNISIPIIWTNEQDSIIDMVNGDSTALKQNPNYAQNTLEQYKQLHPPIVWVNPLDSTQKSKLYFGISALSTQLKWFPIIQLLVVALFITITLIALYTRNKSTQNQLWAGMAKETAHQLGTPLSSLKGWLEVLKNESLDATVVQEIQKDLERLDLVSDRFGKIGSIPKLQMVSILERVQYMEDYMKKRASGKVQFNLNYDAEANYTAPISTQLMDWVLENLYKNALDAMHGNGQIHTTITTTDEYVIIKITDTGKGIPRNAWKNIFKPGYTTKKRGWGLGLSLTKRIVTQYHKGTIQVVESVVNKGTTFMIMLPKQINIK